MLAMTTRGRALLLITLFIVTAAFTAPGLARAHGSGTTAPEHATPSPTGCIALSDGGLIHSPMANMYGRYSNYVSGGSFTLGSPSGAAPATTASATDEWLYFKVVVRSGGYVRHGNFVAKKNTYVSGDSAFVWDGYRWVYVTPNSGTNSGAYVSGESPISSVGRLPRGRFEVWTYQAWGGNSAFAPFAHWTLHGYTDCG
jgi:hypothetical protein